MPGRDDLALLAAIDWTAIVVALITLAGVIFNACLGAFVLLLIRTPSGTRIGKQVEDTQHVSLANNAHLQVMAARDDRTRDAAAKPPTAPPVPDV